jgi:hypothetical protein
MASEDGIHIDCCFVVFVLFPFWGRWKSFLFCRILRADAQGAVPKSHHTVGVEPVLASALLFHIQRSTADDMYDEVSFQDAGSMINTCVSW